MPSAVSSMRMASGASSIFQISGAVPTLAMASAWLVVVLGAWVEARLVGVTSMSGTALVGLTTTGRLWADVAVCPSAVTGVSVTEPKAN